ncbi:hypothetical protein ASPZODRAFT_1056534 [Penicilliopsis zonata CBS 506.65]|uniref:Uncharacterized protein n=1 Tax=Penicilliopsis zonata CBS 506.65 TaxID=1073090 RepID=A0A1L9SS36_9EURO|nr:hypothetical protein ASPZODRAFT_1056534 [Penicilliopsis zonata CBS 506.65]OJJ49891.1 hypothetical protein ASPZODRAFT_1056534 [Penicilliopsis zonata CBS 506.65]
MTLGLARAKFRQFQMLPFAGRDDPLGPLNSKYDSVIDRRQRFSSSQLPRSDLFTACHCVGFSLVGLIFPSPQSTG